ncbi:hypothetical protein GCM10029992_42400 [Glycomyces albus]
MDHASQTVESACSSLPSGRSADTTSAIRPEVGSGRPGVSLGMMSWPGTGIGAINSIQTGSIRCGIGFSQPSLVHGAVV